MPTNPYPQPSSLAVADRTSWLQDLFGEGVGHGAKAADATGFIKTVLHSVSAGVAVFDAAGSALFTNPSYDRANIGDPVAIRGRYHSTTTGWLRVDRTLEPSVAVAVVEMDNGFGIVVEPAQDRLAVREKALTHLVDPRFAELPVHQRAARALGLSGGWRWIGVSRFPDPDLEADPDPDLEAESVRMLGWWDTANIGEPFVLDIEGTGCEVVVRTGQFCFYNSKDELKERFPCWELVDRLDLHAYAGLVYRRNGVPAGHIMALNDGSNVDGQLTEDLLRLFTHHVGTSLELESRTGLATEAANQARLDEVTGLGNRRSFEECAADVGRSYANGELGDAAIVYANLDGSKPANDSLLVAFANVMRTMWRPSDHLFRIGDDEFAMVLPNVAASKRPLLASRLDEGAATFAASKPGVTVSYGVSFVSERNGDLRSACAAPGRP